MPVYLASTSYIEDKMTVLDFQEAIFFIQEKDMIRQFKNKENDDEQY